MSARDFIGGVNWVQSVREDPDVAKLVEKGKKKFAGTEIKDKKIGVIGLGAIGVLVANACNRLGMEVYGYDPLFPFRPPGISQETYAILTTWMIFTQNAIISPSMCPSFHPQKKCSTPRPLKR